MKGLLHSKRFKQNLRKWLLMYVGVMGLLTTVVTYSKYISSLMAEDEARVTNFNVTSKAIACDNTITDKDNTYVCEAALPGATPTMCRPTTQIASCFKVDTRNLEVASTLNLTFDYPDTFEIAGIDLVETKNGTKTYTTVYPDADADSVWKPVSNKSDHKTIIERTIDAATGDEWTFRVRLKRKITNKNDYSIGYSNQSLVNVGYVMEQANFEGATKS